MTAATAAAASGAGAGRSGGGGGTAHGGFLDGSVVGHDGVVDKTGGSAFGQSVPDRAGGPPKVLFCQLWDWDQASAAEREALAEVIAAGGQLTRWDGSVQLACVVCGRGCRVGPRQQQAMVEQNLAVHCFFDAAEVAARAAIEQGAADGAEAAAWVGQVDLGNPQS